MKNKSNFISQHGRYLEAADFKTLNTMNNADTLIVREALQLSEKGNNVTVVGEDIDLLTLLIALTSPEEDVYFLKPGRKNVDEKILSTTQIQDNYPGVIDVILFLHAFSGCDTTSAIFGKRKLAPWKAFNKYKDEIQYIASVFNEPSSTPDDVFKAGCQMFLWIYARKFHLNKLPHQRFVQKSLKSKLSLVDFATNRKRCSSAHLQGV